MHPPCLFIHMSVFHTILHLLHTVPAALHDQGHDGFGRTVFVAVPVHAVRGQAVLGIHHAQPVWGFRHTSSAHSTLCGVTHACCPTHVACTTPTALHLQHYTITTPAVLHLCGLQLHLQLCVLRPPLCLLTHKRAPTSAYAALQSSH